MEHILLGVAILALTAGHAAHIIHSTRRADGFHAEFNDTAERIDLLVEAFDVDIAQLDAAVTAIEKDIVRLRSEVITVTHGMDTPEMRLSDDELEMETRGD